MKTQRYNGPVRYTKAQRKAYMQARERFPEAHVVPGLGWCGPGWQEMAEAERAIEALVSTS